MIAIALLLAQTSNLSPVAMLPAQCDSRIVAEKLACINEYLAHETCGAGCTQAIQATHPIRDVPPGYLATACGGETCVVFPARDLKECVLALEAITGGLEDEIDHVNCVPRARK